MSNEEQSGQIEGLAKILGEAPEFITELLAENEEMARALPLLRYVGPVVRRVRMMRARAFLSTLHNRLEHMSESERRRLDRILASREGAEILTQFVDTTLRTASRIVAAALALLYADVRDDNYPKGFKIKACSSLEGLTDTSVQLFLSMQSVNRFESDTDRGPYPVYFASREVMAHDMNELELDDGSLLSNLDEFIRRGLFAPDPVRARIVGESWRWPFGVNARTQTFWALLGEARRLVESE